MATALSLRPVLARQDAASSGRGWSWNGWRLLGVVLLALDAVALGTAFAAAYLVRFKTGLPLLETPPHTRDFYVSVAFFAVPAGLALFSVYRLYDRRTLSTDSEYVQVINACTAGMIVVLSMSFLVPTLIISRGWLLMTWALSIVLTSAGRFVARHAVRYLRRRGALLTPVVIVGANEEGKTIAEQLLPNPSSGVRVLGFLDRDAAPGTSVVGGLSVLGRLADAPAVVRRAGARELVVAPTALDRHELLDLYRTFGWHEGVEVRLSSGLFEILTTGVRVQEVSGVPLLTPLRVRITGLDALLKTITDYALAAVGLVVLSPVLVVLGLLVRLDSAGPIIHRRRVLGRSSRPFDAFKFRTMVVNADEVLAQKPVLREAFEKQHKLRDDPRVTRIGRFLRRTSLDELPQLINVLRGEMSLVGPRMIAPDEASRYGKWDLNLLTVKPGITGPWQVAGRSELPYEERVRLSMRYVRNYSIWLDLEILVRTIFVVLRRSGAY